MSDIKMKTKDITLEQVLPQEIEKRSFEIITKELGDRIFEADQESIIKRCIHTAADFDYVDKLCFSDHAVAIDKEAIQQGACIVTDTQMAKAAMMNQDLIFAIGNAPTALVKLYELIEDGKLKPKLIIGAPVGFVNVVQAKELIMKTKSHIKSHIL